MKKIEDIKWACIQPLTGGMYIGALEAIGHDAEFILSYEGLDEVKHSKDGSMTSVANEYNLMQWLKSHGKNVPYYKIHRQMFDLNVEEMNPEITCNDVQKTPDYEDLDLVVSVPVCSGLSMATSATADTKNARNCNMIWLANYALNKIRPKMYIFENAPTLMGSRGTELRTIFEKMAMKYGYSLLYYKTDTSLHDNCQKRPRTFVIFQKWENGVQSGPAQFKLCDNQVDAVTFFKRIPMGLEQDIPVKSSPHNYMMIDFIKEDLGKDWSEKIDGCLMNSVIARNKLDDFLNYINKHREDYPTKDVDRAIKYISHIKYKTSIGKNYYGDDICLCKDKFPAIQFRSIPNLLHPSGKRLCTIREYLELMGMPHDFILYGDTSNLPKIGQNVPVKTAKWIVENAVKVLVNDEPRLAGSDNVVFQDNIKKQVA